MKKCELCNSRARMYCESDEASLCWDCDSRVHSANFLVSKHPRNLLCHVCQSLTPWTASGPKLAPTLSFCQSCADSRRRISDPAVAPNAHDDDGENQVVPLPPPAASSSSSSEDSTSRRYLQGTGRNQEINGGRRMRSRTWR